MKRLLLLLLLGFAAVIPVSAQQPSSFTLGTRLQGATLPASCTDKRRLFTLTAVDGANQPGLYRCNGSAYVAVSDGAGTVATSGSPASPQLAKFSSATAITTATATDVSTPSQCADAGSTDTYACNLAPALTSYIVGTKLRFLANTANTGAASINYNSLGALTIVKMAGGVTTALEDNDIRIGQWVEGTIAASNNFQMTSQVGNAASSSPGGADTQVQFNDAGAFGGDADFTWNKTTNRLILPATGGLTIGGNAYLYTSGVGPKWYDSTADFLLTHNIQGLTDNRTATWPDAAGTVTLGGNTFTGTGAVVRATSPTLVTPILGAASATSYATETNCADSAGAAACGSAAAGSVVIDAAATTVVVSTTAVTANSQIFIQEDLSLGTRLGVTCNTTIARTYAITARTAATSFTITASAAPVTNPSCLSYTIVN